jgi:fumarate hydratase class I
MIKLTSPTNEKQIRSLNIGDVVSITGTIATGRDEVHKYLFENFNQKVAAFLMDSFIYHSGPIVKKIKNGYDMVCCGPTTSIREEPYQAEIIKKYHIRGVIGKGGMGDSTLCSLKEFGAVYLHAPGGAAALLGKCVKKITNVYFLDKFGSPEAMWILQVEDFPAIVTMDSHGRSLHEKVFQESALNYKKILDKIK